jgi:hypothetical protein
MKLLQGIRFLAPHLCVIGRLELKNFPNADPEELIAKEMLRIIQAAGIESQGFFTIRKPPQNLSVRDRFYKKEFADRQKSMGSHDGWHKDVLYGTRDAMILWSNNTPTEFLLPNGKIVQPAPSEVVLALNSAMEHRVPLVIGQDRWFCRAMAEVPEWL